MVSVTVVLVLAGGLAALAVPAVLLVGWWQPRWVPLLAFALMCGAGAVTVSGLTHGTQPGFGAFSWPAQALALAALAAALTPLRPPSAFGASGAFGVHGAFGAARRHAPAATTGTGGGSEDFR